MPFDRPSLRDLVGQVETDVAGRLPDAWAKARRSVAGVLARAVAGVAHGLYAYLQYLADQRFVHRADAEHLPLHGRRWQVARKAAARASGAVVLTGADGAAVPLDTVLQAAGGTRYTVTASAIVSGGTATVTVEADAPGAVGNQDAGAPLSLVSPVAGITSTGTAAAGGLAGGADIEDLEVWRARIIERIHNPPHGGAGADYIRWAKEVPGVTKAWARPGQLGAGTVVVLVWTPEGAPAPALLTDVAAHIETVRPVTAEVTVLSPTAVPFAVEIAGLSPDTPEVRAAIEAEIADLLAREAEPGGVILLSHLREAISAAAGETDHVVVQPAADVVIGANAMPVFTPVTWS